MTFSNWSRVMTVLQPDASSSFADLALSQKPLIVIRGLSRDALDPVACAGLEGKPELAAFCAGPALVAWPHAIDPSNNHTIPYRFLFILPNLSLVNLRLIAGFVESFNSALVIAPARMRP